MPTQHEYAEDEDYSMPLPEGSPEKQFATLGSFVWEPLSSPDDIRLLDIRPVARPRTRAAFICTLATYHKDSVPDYHAISYTWGDASTLQTIICNGMVLEVTANCVAALNAVRRRSKTGKVWLDAICIDQLNVRERSEQVARMGRIFSGAMETFVYLGEDDTASSFFFDAIERYERRLPQLVSEQAGRVALLKRHTKLGFVFSTEAWHEFFTRPWFSRVWVIQEFLMARQCTLLCGRNKVAWDAFQEFVASSVPTPDGSGIDIGWGVGNSNRNPVEVRNNLERLGVPRLVCIRVELSNTSRSVSHAKGRDSPRPGSSPRADYAPARRYSQPYSPPQLPRQMLLNYLRATRHFGCQDPRDKIYALLPLFEQPLPTLLIPDYSKSIADVYADFTVCCLELGDSSILSLAGEQQGAADLPSFAVDWRKQRSNPPFDLEGRFEGQDPGLRPAWYAGFGHMPPKILWNRFDGDLLLRGRIIDRVARLGPAREANDASGKFLMTTTASEIRQWIREWEDSVHAGLDCTFPDAQRDAEGRCVAQHRLSTETCALLGLAPKNMDENWSCHQGPIDLDDLLVSGIPAASYYRGQPKRSFNRVLQVFEMKKKSHSLTQPAAALFRCLGRRPIITSAGLVGIAPACTEVGDVVCVLIGFKAPFLLRPSHGRWRLVGECLVDGIMQGEAVANLDWARMEDTVPPPPVQDFRIC